MLVLGYSYYTNKMKEDMEMKGFAKRASAIFMTLAMVFVFIPQISGSVYAAKNDEWKAELYAKAAHELRI